MKYLSVIVFIVFIALLSSCKERKGYVDKLENNGDEVYGIETEDTAMNRAIETAKNTYDRFLLVFRKQDSSTHDFTVKLRFPYEENSAEHMWLSDLYFNENKLFGVLNSNPVYVKTVQWGDTMEVKRESLSDWMYIENNRMKGGYTIRVLYDKMSEAEKKDFRKEVDFDIE